MINNISKIIGSRLNTGISKEKMISMGKRLMNNEVEFTVTLSFFAEGNDMDMIKDIEANFLHNNNIRTRKAVIMNNESRISDEVIETLYPQLFRITPQLFLHNKLHHPCLHRSISLEIDGSLSSCPFLPGEALGTIRDSRGIDRIFESERVFEHWGLNLAKIDKCKSCEFKYGCIDCRALGKTLTGNLYGKKLCLSKDRKEGISST